MSESMAGLPSFTALLDVRRGVPIVNVSGELDLQSAPRLRALLDEAMNRLEGRYVVADLSRVSFMDSTGLGILLAKRELLRSNGGDLMLVVRNGAAGRLIGITGLDEVFYLCPDANTAVEIAAK